jgi:hypothetical protein
MGNPLSLVPFHTSFNVEGKLDLGPIRTGP